MEKIPKLLYIWTLPIFPLIFFCPLNFSSLWNYDHCDIFFFISIGSLCYLFFFHFHWNSQLFSAPLTKLPQAEISFSHSSKILSSMVRSIDTAIASQTENSAMTVTAATAWTTKNTKRTGKEPSNPVWRETLRRSTRRSARGRPASRSGGTTRAATARDRAAWKTTVNAMR